MYKSGDAFIEVLNAHNVDKIFINPGFEAIGVISAIASARVEKKQAPQLVLCLDESVTASAAYGNFMVSGNPQVVMVHSEVGSLQLGANLVNLQWGRIPTVILAASQEIDRARTVWDGRPYDQGGIVRNSVKYERHLNGDEDLHEALIDAFKAACTEPCGPVYLTFPMDYLYKELTKPAAAIAPASIDSLPKADDAVLGEMADILFQAKNPLIVCGSAGRHPQNVETLTKLAEALSANVLTGYSWMNFPTNHPLCVGIEQIGGSRKEDSGYEDADVILAIDYDMPYVGSAPPVNPSTKILHIDSDPLTQGRVLWQRGADLFLKADSREALPALIGLYNNMLTESKKAELADRYKKLADINESNRAKWYSDADKLAKQSKVTADYLCYCVNQLIDKDTIVVNHTLSHCASVTEQIVRTEPKTWFGCPSGAIGWAPGAALGAASAAPDKTVVAFITDGGFVWGCPTSTLWTSTSYKFPFLTIICNNNGYGAIRDVQEEVTPNVDIDQYFLAESGVDFRPDYSLIAQGAGAFGKKITKADEVIPAIKEALEVVRNGKPAVLDVYLDSKQ